MISIVTLPGKFVNENAPRLPKGEAGADELGVIDVFQGEGGVVVRVGFVFEIHISVQLHVPVLPTGFDLQFHSHG